MFKEFFPLEHEEEDEKVESTVAVTAVYVKDLAHELAKLAQDAGCTRLSKLLTLAALEAQLCHSCSTWDGMDT
jgi:hypothetical protein